MDFNLHDLVGIRLRDASARDTAVVREQIGPLGGRIQGPPDITVRFVDRLELDSPQRYVGLNDVAFTEHDFLILQGGDRQSARVSVPMERIGARCEIVCERRLAAVPLLLPIINMTALAKGILPLHASAFVYRGVGVLVTGWAKGGKTEALLAFMAAGAEYVGDEWVYLTPGGTRMYGIPEPIRFWDWHLRDLPAMRRSVGARGRAKLRLTRALSRAAESLVLGPSSWRRTTRRLAAGLSRQRYVRIPPRRMFGADACRLEGVPERVFFVASHAALDTRVVRMTPDEVSRRMVHSLHMEYATLLACYDKYRFAFPDRRNPLLDSLQAHHARLMSVALSGKETYGVYHPYPVSVAELFEAMRPIIAHRSTAPQQQRIGVA